MSHELRNEEFSLKQYFSPLTTSKAINFIIIIGFIVFGNALFNGFVWDDVTNILYNQQIQTFNLNNIFSTGTVNLGLQYRPFVNFYFSLMYAIFKDLPFFYHFVNIVFHIVNTIFVLIFFKRFLKKQTAFFLSLIFLIHPMQVESATWISTAGNFYFLFGIAAILFSMIEKISKRRMIVIGSCLLLSLLSKETGIAFIGIIFFYQLIYKKKDIYYSSFINIFILFVYFIMRVIIAKITFEAPSSIVPIARLSFIQRLINIPEIIFYYFKTFFDPLQLVIMQYWIVTQKNLEYFYVPLFFDLLLFITIVLFGLFIFKFKRKYFHFFILSTFWLFIGFLFNIQISPLNMTVADRWFYFPMVGILGILGVGVELIAPVKKKNKVIEYTVTGFVLVILLFLSIRTIVRNNDWKNDLSLYLHDRKIMTNFNMENNIGWNYQHQGDFNNALKYYKNSVVLYPYYAISINNTAYAYLMLNDKKDAKTYLYKVLKADDYYPELYDSDLLLSVLIFSKSYSLQETKDFITKALIRRPRNGLLWENLALIEYKLGNQKEAKNDIKKASQLLPNNQNIKDIDNQLLNI